MWLIVATTATGESECIFSGEQNAAWRHIQPFGFDTPMPIRLVGPDEPRRLAAGRPAAYRLQSVRAGSACRVLWPWSLCQARRASQARLTFRCCIGIGSPDGRDDLPATAVSRKNPLQDIPQDILHLPLKDLFKNPAEIIEIARHKAHQLASESRYATAHAAVRLTAGISAFHRQHMTPSLAAFSNSALVIVKMGQLLEHGMISDGYQTIPVAQDVRQSIYVKNVVTFGYPLPHGHVPRPYRTGSLARLRTLCQSGSGSNCGEFSPPGGGRERLSSRPRRITIGQDSTPRARSRSSERSLGVEHIPRDERPG